MSVEMIGWAVLAGVAGLAIYTGHCVWRPFAACRKCEGSGSFRSKSGRSWRDCRKCGGSGRRVRFGHKLWTWLADRKHDAVG